jgi:DNA-binding response OmpR family regulator
MESPPRPRILCAEDNEDTCFLLQTLLGQENYAVESADTVEKALALAKKESFDLYLLANRFEDGTGLELCLKIREFDRRTPIIFYSGAAYEKDQEEALRAGAQAYIVKPGIDGIVETIKALLSKAKE